MLEINVAHGVGVSSRKTVYWKSMPRRKATRGNHNIKLEVIHMFDLNVNFLGL